MRGEWKTPAILFETLHREFHFTLDVCAAPWNAQCERFFTPDENGLTQQWRGVCWCNPPFDELRGAWVKKAWEESQRGVNVVVVIPGNYYDADWWHRYALRSTEIRFVRGRPNFLDETGRKARMKIVIIVFLAHCKGPAATASILCDGQQNNFR